MTASAWPAARTNGGTFGLAVRQTRTEFLQNWRMPEFMIGVVAIPAILYLMFGLPSAGERLAAGTDVGAMMLASFGGYGLVSLAIFTFGVDIAHERGRGWWRVLRASPVPSWVYFTAKIVMALLYGVVIIALLAAIAILLGGVSLPLSRWLAISGMLLVGAVVFAPFGFALAFFARPRAASTIGNLIFLPLSFASGFFFPLSELPSFVQNVAPYLPTYHFGQLVWSQVGDARDVAVFASGDTGTWVHIAWVAGSFVMFGIVALIGYRRDEHVRAA
jgi:ABC-2 type transport system permease protein